MSINVLGLPTNVETNAFPLASSLPLNPATHNVTATNNSPNDIIVNNLADLSLSGLTTSAQGSLTVGTTLAALDVSSYQAIIEATSIVSNTDVTASTPNLSANSINATVSVLASPAVTSLQSSVTQYGITWTFDTDYEVGQYVNGDYFVVDPGAGVTINSVSPTPGGGRNGSHINPVTDDNQPFDDRDLVYSAAIAASFPASLTAGDVILSSVSRTTETTWWDGTPLSGVRNYIVTIAMLNCVSSVPFSDSFRPPYLNPSQTQYRRSQVNSSILPGLTAPASMPSVPNYLERGMEQPWISHGFNFTARGMHPTNAQNGYHRDIGNYLSQFCTFLMTADVTTDAITNFCQWTLDQYTMAISAGEGDSAFWAGPVVLGGLLLQAPEIYRFSLDGNIQNTVSRDYEKFYYYADRTSTQTSAIVPAGEVWSGWGNGPEGNPVFFRKQTGNQEYEHMDPSEWGTTNYGSAEGYKECCDTWPHIGMILAGFLMDAGTSMKTYWNHDATFDFADRWMNEPVSVYTGTGFSAPNTMETSNNTFIDEMWEDYR